jgi:uncharacterized membrane protein
VIGSLDIFERYNGVVTDRSNLWKPNRRVLVISASLCAMASAVLFVFRPIPPVGLVAAIDLAALMVCLLYMLFFPRHIEQLQQRAERALEKEPRINIGKWVP